MKLFQHWKRPSPENATQTLTSAMSDPEYYKRELNGKVLYRHDTASWDKFIEEKKSIERDNYFAIITEPKQLALLNRIAAKWTDLDRRKDEIDQIISKTPSKNVPNTSHQILSIDQPRHVEQSWLFARLYLSCNLAFSQDMSGCDQYESSVSITFILRFFNLKF